MKTTREDFYKLVGCEGRPAYSILYPSIVGRELPAWYPRGRRPVWFKDRRSATQALRKHLSILRRRQKAGDSDVSTDVIDDYYICAVIRFSDGSILTPQGILFR